MKQGTVSWFFGCHSIIHSYYAWKYEPYWWAWWNALVEPKLKMGYSLREAYTRFHASVKKNIDSGELRSTHQLYLERCKKEEE